MTKELEALEKLTSHECMTAEEFDELKKTIKQALIKQEEMKAKVEWLLRKLPNIQGYKKEIDVNLDFSITIDKLKEWSETND